MVRTIGALIVGTVIGVAVAKVSGNSATATPNSDKTKLSATAVLDQAEYIPGDPENNLDPRYVRMLDALAELLDQEVAERHRLEEKLDSLTKKIEMGTLGNTKSAQRSARTRLFKQRQQNTLVSRLTSAGMDERDALDIKARVDEISLARLSIQDQSSREGWDGKKTQEALRELNQRSNNLRSELGEKKFDMYLYASGVPNRVSVMDVLVGSEAERVGIRPGDIILSYGGERLYNQRELRTGSLGGIAGQSVAVDIVRGNQQMQVYMPRGPLGVQLGRETVNPNGG